MESPNDQAPERINNKKSQNNSQSKKRKKHHKTKVLSNIPAEQAGEKSQDCTRGLSSLIEDAETSEERISKLCLVERKERYFKSAPVFKLMQKSLRKQIHDILVSHKIEPINIAIKRLASCNIMGAPVVFLITHRSRDVTTQFKKQVTEETLQCILENAECQRLKTRYGLKVELADSKTVPQNEERHIFHEEKEDYSKRRIRNVELRGSLTGQSVASSFGVSMNKKGGPETGVIGAFLECSKTDDIYFLMACHTAHPEGLSDTYADHGDKRRAIPNLVYLIPELSTFPKEDLERELNSAMEELEILTEELRGELTQKDLKVKLEDIEQVRLLILQLHLALRGPILIGREVYAPPVEWTGPNEYVLDFALCKLIRSELPEPLLEDLSLCDLGESYRAEDIQEMAEESKLNITVLPENSCLRLKNVMSKIALKNAANSVASHLFFVSGYDLGLRILQILPPFPYGDKASCKILALEPALDSTTTIAGDSGSLVVANSGEVAGIHHTLIDDKISAVVPLFHILDLLEKRLEDKFKLWMRCVKDRHAILEGWNEWYNSHYGRPRNT